MDPNECLRRLRDAINAQAEAVAEDDSYEVVGYFRALDKWLSEGNFLPADWRH